MPDGQDTTLGPRLDPELLAIDDHGELPERWRGASRALDAWLRRAHGILATTHNELGWLLAMLDAEGYTVLAPDPADE